MGEQIVLSYLTEKLKVPVCMEMPDSSIVEFVLIERIGGNGDEFISNATIAIQSYSETLYRTAELNKKVKQEMLKITCLRNVSKIKLNSDYNFTDTERKRYRYQAIYEMVYFE